MQYHDIKNTLEYFSIWDRADDRYKYILSPASFPISPQLSERLTELARAVASFQSGMCAIEGTVSQQNGNVQQMVHSIIQRSCCGLPRCSGDPVPLCKVDVVIDADENPWAVEIDAYNPRGLLFAAFLAYTQKRSDPEARTYQGVCSYLLDHLNAAGAKRVLWVYAERERFYLPWFYCLAELLKEHGVTLTVCSTKEVTKKEIESHDRIVMIPINAHHKSEITGRELLLRKYGEDPSAFLYPLVPWLGAKNLLALASNPSGHEKIEELVTTHVPDVSLVRRFIPRSLLVSKFFRDDIPVFKEQHRCVLKESVSSGMKGVWSDHDPEFEERLRPFVKAKRAQAILQEHISQQTFRLPYYHDANTIAEDDWYVRLTAHVASDGTLVDAQITARTTPDVHGATDCLMLPCTLQ